MTTRDEQAAALFRALADLYAAPAVVAPIPRLTAAAHAPRWGSLSIQQTMPACTDPADVVSRVDVLQECADPATRAAAIAQGVALYDYGLLWSSIVPKSLGGVEPDQDGSAFQGAWPTIKYTTGPRFSVWNGDTRVGVNLVDPTSVAVNAGRLVRVAASAGGLFLDEMGAEYTYLVGQPEYPDEATVVAAIANALAQLRAALPASTPIALNCAEHADADHLRWAHAADCPTARVVLHFEDLTNPARRMGDRWTELDPFIAAGFVVQTVPALAERDYASWESTTYPPGNSASAADRGRLFELASHYLTLTTPAQCRLAPINSGKDQQPWESVWRPMYEYDLGLPTGPRSLVWSGTDGAGQPAEVWQRQFAHALVLVRPSHTDTQSDAKFDDSTAIALSALGVSATQALGAQGLGAAPATIRNGEAVIVVT